MKKCGKVSKLSFSSLNCHFGGRITKMITRVNSRILRIHPIYIFGDFSSLKIRKNPRFHCSNHSCDFPKKYNLTFFHNSKLGLKTKILKFLGIQPKQNGVLLRDGHLVRIPHGAV